MVAMGAFAVREPFFRFFPGLRSLMESSVASRAEILVEARRHKEAADLLFGAAAGGDAGALATLARWRISGDVIRRDLPAARDLLARAGAAGDGDAALLHTYFLASGMGGSDDWKTALSGLKALAADHPAAADQLRVLDEMDLDGDGFPASPVATSTLSARPHVAAAERFATAAECAYLVKAVEAALTPSMVVHPQTGRLIPHPVRTSDAAMFGVYAEDLVVNAINRRIAAFSATSIVQGEPLQLLRYRPGGEYRAHMDALPAEPNQRIATVLVYLSDGYQGGETQFPRTGLSFKGRAGDALLFRNVTDSGEPDPMAIHAGLPVGRGVKIIASRWIRAQRFTYPPPQPLLML
jgi:prolyl 4-hydroxylase